MANSKSAEGEDGNKRLDTWKEISTYLDRDVTTVMRWERERALPVHRVPGHAKRQTVYAYPREIDEWLLGPGDRSQELGDRSQEPEVRSQEPGVASLRNGTGGAEREVGAKHGRPASTLREDEERTNVLSPWMAALVPHGRRQFFTYLITAGSVAAALVVVYVLARPPAVPRVRGTIRLTDDAWEKGSSLVTDGANLYFTELTSSGWIIARVPTSGGIPSSISPPFKSPKIEDISKSRGEILILDPRTPRVRGRLWAMPVSGNAPRRVGNIAADSASWGPHGNTIYYTVGREIFACNLDGSGSRKFAALPGNPSELHWSPDGRIIRFSIVLPPEYTPEIWEMKSDGSGAHKLLADSRPTDSQSSGDWTDSGRYFVFARGLPEPHQVWALRDKGGLWGTGISRPSQLSYGAEDLGAWTSSPDGKKIFVLAGQVRKMLYRYLSGEHRFVRFLPAVSGDEVDFSPDGQWFAYVGMRDSALWKRRLDGSQTAQLTFSFSQVELPRWSPDGKWIGFMGLKSSADIWRAYVMPSDGGEARAVMPSAVAQGAPTWSPHGRRVMFGELPHSGVGAGAAPVIHMVDLATHQATTLPGSSGLWTARWSPDGRRVAAITTDSKTLKIFDFQTGQWKDFAAASQITDMNWSRDGRTIYFEDSLPPTGPAIYRVLLGGRKAEKVASQSRAMPIESTWLGLAPDGSVLISNAVDASEIYALDVTWP
ncbi:MAG TPA: hypothetical protein VG028_20580 [Terriglobia bacterium]|nr:hypothetical protein [Terriglobia bacterium]